MSGRAWAMMAAALLVSLVGVVLHAQMGGALGVPSGAAGSGGGTTVGAAVSGGTASRLLFSDGSTQVSTASPALGAALDLSSTLTVDGALSNDSANTCSTTGAFAGAMCVADTDFTLTSATSRFNAHADGTDTAQGPGMLIYEGVGPVVFKGAVRRGGSTFGITALRNKLAMYSGTGESVALGANTDVGGAFPVLQVYDDLASGAGNLLWDVDGVGYMTTAGGAYVAGAATLNSTLGVTGAATLSSTADIRGAISNGGSGTCFGSLTGVPCFAEQIGIINTGAGNSSLHIRNNTTTTGASIELYNSSATNMASMGYYGSSLGAGIADKVGIFSRASTPVFTGSLVDVSAGTNVFEVRDGTVNMPNLLASVDGAGNLQLAAGATRSKGTITLAAGTGTVTVASGSVCVCSDTTAVNAVQCAVAATTLTATGTGTDVIAYHCM